MRGITEERLRELIKDYCDHGLEDLVKYECTELNPWRPIEGYEDKYEVCTLGIIRKISGEIVGTWLNDQGYVLARLSNPRVVVRMHRIVARAFIPNPNNFTVINHIDHCRSNNNIDNLEWCTQKHNVNHAIVNGRMPNDYWVGKRSPNAALPDEVVTKIKLEYMAGGVSHNNLAMKYGVSKRTIGRIVNGETYV